MECELCGSRNAGRRIKIDKAILTVCDECVSFGQEIPTVEIRPAKKFIQELEVPGQDIMPNFNVMIRGERAKRNLTQEELAKKLNEKYSLIKRIEDGWEPPMTTVKKLEGFFGIKLTEEVVEKKIQSKTDGTKLTIGDVVELG